MQRRLYLFFKLALPCFLVVFGVFFAPHFLLAQVDPVATAKAAGAAVIGGEAAIYGTIFNIIAQILSFIAGGLGQIALVIIEMIIVPILNYNSFSTSPIIGLGWSLVRDTMNMGVIIALLFIAIFTIVGNHRAHWEQQIPQLFIAVVFMNFSRTICGILIDISQVVMFTFVNALLDIAAGNFVQLFSLNKFGQYDVSAAEGAIAQGGNVLLNGSSNLVNAFLQIPLYGSVVAILLLLALAFLWRIVVLWILVIMSPMAFFLGGVKGIFPQAGGAHGEWWGKFIAALAMGPLLTFFLWLALAAASGGSIVQSEHFPTPDSPQTYGLDLTVFRSDNLMGTILALILLVIGMQQAGAYASKLDGVAKSAINEGMGRKIVGGALKLPFQGASAVGRRLDRYNAPAGSLTFTEAVGKDIIGLGGQIASSNKGTPILGGLSTSIGSGIMNVGSKFEVHGEHIAHGDIQIAKDRVKNMGDDTKLGQINILEQLTNHNLQGTRDVGDVLAGQIATDSNLQKKFKDHYGKDRLNAILGVALPLAKKKKGLILEDAQKKSLDGQFAKHLDTLPLDVDGDPEVLKKQKEDLRKVIDSDDFEYRKLYGQADIFEGTGETDQRAQIRRDLLATKVVRNTKDGPITVMDEALSGALGIEVQKAVQPFAGDYRGRASEARMASLRGSDTAGDQLRDRFKGNKGLAGALVVADFSSGERGNENAAAIVNADLNVDSIGGNRPAEAVEVQQEFRNNVINNQSAEVIQKAISNGQVAPVHMPAQAFEAASPNRDALVTAILKTKADAKDMSPDAQDAYKTAVDEMRAQNKLSARQATEAKALLIDVKGDIESVVNRFNSNNGALSAADTKTLRDLLTSRPEAVRYAAPAVVGQPAANDVTRVVADAATTKGIRDLGAKYLEAVRKNQGQIEIEMEAALNSFHEAIDQQLKVAQAAGNATDIAKYNGLKSESDQVRSRIGLT